MARDDDWQQRWASVGERLWNREKGGVREEEEPANREKQQQKRE